MSLKNGYQHIIDSLYITYNDNPINQPAGLANVASTWKLYKISADDRQKLRDLLNFYMDNSDTIRYVTGIGETNNVISTAT